MKIFKIAIGSDHVGFKYKEAIKAMLLAEGHTVRDFGTCSSRSCDYPDFIRPTAEAVACGENMLRRSSPNVEPRGGVHIKQLPPRTLTEHELMNDSVNTGGAAPALAAHSKDASAPGQTPASSAKPSPLPTAPRDKLSNTAGDVMEKVSDTASEYGGRVAEQAADFIREKPMFTVVATGLMCLAVGLLLARR